MRGLRREDSHREGSALNPMFAEDAEVKTLAKFMSCLTGQEDISLVVTGKVLHAGREIHRVPYMREWTSLNMSTTSAGAKCWFNAENPRKSLKSTVISQRCPVENSCSSCSMVRAISGEK